MNPQHESDEIGCVWQIQPRKETSSRKYWEPCYLFSQLSRLSKYQLCQVPWSWDQRDNGRINFCLKRAGGQRLGQGKHKWTQINYTDLPGNICLGQVTDLLNPVPQERAVLLLVPCSSAPPLPRITGFDCCMVIGGRCKSITNKEGLIVFTSSPFAQDSTGDVLQQHITYWGESGVLHSDMQHKQPKKFHCSLAVPLQIWFNNTVSARYKCLPLSMAERTA